MFTRNQIVVRCRVMLELERIYSKHMSHKLGTLDPDVTRQTERALRESTNRCLGALHTTDTRAWAKVWRTERPV